MSPSMVLGRVILPLVGLVLAVALCWQTVRAVTGVQTGPVRTVSDQPRLKTSAPSLGRINAEGRIVTYPGGLVTVGTTVLGVVVRMPVREKSTVKKGDVLVELRDDDTRAGLREAHSRLVEAEADLRFEQERLRLDRLIPALAGREPRSLGSRPDMSAATARRDAAKAAVERLEAELARYRVLAPMEGVVLTRHVSVGETVNAAAPLVTIADLSRLRVEAEVDEFDIGRVAQGADVVITAEGYRDKRWRGKVEEIADAVVSRQTRPEDPARATDTRVLPVRIKLLESVPLKLGQRVEVEIAGQDADR